MTDQQALDLAMDHHRGGRLAEAESIYRQLRARHPQNADLVHLLGVLARDAGQLEAGLELIQTAIAANPTVSQYYNNLGLVLTDLVRCEDAVAALQTAIRLEPQAAEAYYNLGIALAQQHRHAESVAAYREAIRLRPNYSLAQLNLGIVLSASGQEEEAISYYQSVVQSGAATPAIMTNLGSLLRDRGNLDAAMECYRMALTQAPGDPVVLNNLGLVHKDRGEIETALELLRRSLDSNPTFAELHSNLIFTSYFDPDISVDAITEEHRRWNGRHAAPLENQRQPLANDRSAGRRLRVGYVSADFRDHVVGRALLPSFAAHDREQFELFCYAGNGSTDAVAEQFRRLSSAWCDTTRLTDEKLAERIRADRIDILVDLSQHTACHRLLVFARRPAPVQVAWLGYPGTTGLAAMDYRITDPFLDPPGQDYAGSFEEPVRLPHCWSCYPAPAESPEPGELPAPREGVVTFGSFNNFAKMNDRVMGLWAEILHRVSGSRLLLLSKSGGEDRPREFFQRRGLGPDRVEFVGYYPKAAVRNGLCSPMTWLHRYQRIDIALDPFPYNGMTTTGDALWMGVPVIALIGGTTLGRASFSLLSNVGLGNLAASTESEYVEIATALAGDLPSLAQMRATLRDRMGASPLRDIPRFTRDLEAAYRKMWQRWSAAST